VKIEFKKSFYKGFDKYSKKEQENIFKTIRDFINSIEKHKLHKAVSSIHLKADICDRNQIKMQSLCFYL